MKSKKVDPLVNEEADAIPGVPTEEELKQKVATLNHSDKLAFTKIKKMLAEHMGSYAAARAWLITENVSWGGIPMEIILKGEAKLMLAYFEEHYGPNGPIFA